MKKLMLFVVLMMASIGFGATTTNSKERDGRTEIYYHCSSTAPKDFNDSNTTTTATKICANFYGEIMDVFIDPNGTEASFQIVFYIDPIEIGETQVKKLYIVKTFSGLAATTDYYYYVLNASDESSNVFGGPLLIGDLYLGRQNIANTMDDLKIYINCKTK